VLLLTIERLRAGRGLSAREEVGRLGRHVPGQLMKTMKDSVKPAVTQVGRW
jgi:hypothetical protein